MSHDSPHSHGFTPPEHPNARAHEEMMAELRRGGTQAMIELMKSAGVLDESGELTEPYEQLLREDEQDEREAS